MSKTCLLDATAHILAIADDPEGQSVVKPSTIRDILKVLIKHDGSDRGYHSQEIQDAIYELGYLMIRHELYPCLQVYGTIVPIYSREEVEERFLPRLNRNNGVLVVRHSNGIHHALSFQKGSNTAYDVAKDEFVNLEDLDIIMFLEFVNVNPTH